MSRKTYPRDIAQKLITKVDKALGNLQLVKQEAYDFITPSSDDEVLALFYWNDEFSSKEIAKRSGLTERELREVSSVNFSLPYCCPNGHDVEVHITSRTAYKALAAKTIPCPECKRLEDLGREARSREFQDSKIARQECIRQLKAMPYRDYLQTPHWQEVRRYMLKRARYKCSLCNKNGRLDVHHKTYENRGCEEETDLTVLCRECHAKFHDKVVR